MDMELHDWEVLDPLPNTTTTTTTFSISDDIERASEGIIKSDYFSIDFHNKYSEDLTDQISVDSDNPSWIDPVCDTNYTKTKPTGDFWSTDSSSDDDGRYVESESSNNQLAQVEVKVESKPDEESGERNSVGVWWKLPFDLFKYCLFKAGPVWTVSVTAAMMGVVILGRRLYRMKRKPRSLQIKVAIDDDKKVSQVMSRVARVNEAFSVVKRVPILRPLLPAGNGIAPWPMMALR